ncbi:response regulator [Lentibacter algarum]|uniref:response regulator n=1 Tax=Lentibacter algarum TaxID=576131 RepID=UPI001C09B252|nr:response regulator [Lentibacter algarum]
MNLLIVEDQTALAELWRKHLERQGAIVTVAASEDSAVSYLQEQKFSVVILDLDLAKGSALAIADFASFRLPEVQVICVTSSSFFSDGSIFNLCSNACALIQADTPPNDIAAMAEHFGSRAS